MVGTEATQGIVDRGTESKILENRLSRNWYALAGVSVISTLGMAIAVAPVLSDQFGHVWPWPNTHIVLLGGLTAAVALLVAHLTVQQRRITSMRGTVKKLEHSTEERKRQNRMRLGALLNISKMMGAVNDPENVFSSITSTCKEIFDGDQASLMLMDGDSGELKTRSATGHLNMDKVRNARQKIGEGIAGWVAKAQEPVILGPSADMNRYPGLELKSRKLTAAMVVPILLRGEVVGVLSVRSRNPDTEYRQEDCQALQVFAENAGTVIRHSEQAQWMRRMIEKQRSAKPNAPVS